MMSKTMCCSVCKQDNISWRVWADENDNVLDSCEEKYSYRDRDWETHSFTHHSPPQTYQ